MLESEIVTIFAETNTNQCQDSSVNLDNNSSMLESEIVTIFAETNTNQCSSEENNIPNILNSLEILHIDSTDNKDLAINPLKSNGESKKSKVIIIDTPTTLKDNFENSKQQTKKPMIKLINVINNNVEEELMSLSVRIGLKIQGSEILRERLLFEIDLIGLIKKLIEDSRYSAKENQLSMIDYLKISFGLAKLAYIKYYLIIRPLMIYKVNTLDLPDNIWRNLKDSQEFTDIINRAKEFVLDQEILYPNYYITIVQFLKNNKHQPDYRFHEMLVEKFDNESYEKLISFMLDIGHEMVKYFMERPVISDQTIRFSFKFLDVLHILQIKKRIDVMMYVQTIQKESSKHLQQKIDRMLKFYKN